MAQQKPSIRLTSPRGRLVQGDAFEPNTTDQHGAPLVVKTGANKGQPRKEWFIAVAYAKNDPATLPYLMNIMNFTASQWPHIFPNGVQPTPPMFGCVHPSASFKIMDGDGMDDNGKQNREKPGFAGHWVVKYSTGLQAPGVWQEPNFDEMARINDPRQLPRGYFVMVNHTVESNGVDNSPGCYINLDKVAICANQVGAEIIQAGPTAAEAFGGGGAAVPPSYAPPPVAPVAGTPAAYTPPVPAPAGAIASPSNPAPPAYAGYIPGAAPPPSAPVPPVPAAPPARVMLPAANGATYDAMKAAGWSDEMLVQHGMMMP